MSKPNHLHMMLIGQQKDEAGRNTKYEPEMCDRLRAMGEQGMWPEEWMAHLGIGRSTMYNWANRYPEFGEAVDIAWYLCAAFWSKWMRDNITHPNAKASIVAKVSARFPSLWGKNPIITHEHFMERNLASLDGQAVAVGLDGRVKMTKEQMEAKIAELTERRKHAGGGE